MIRSSLALALALALAAPAGAASFTYRGHLEDSGQPAEGSYRLELRLYADREGRQPLAAPVVVDEVTIKGGRFAVGVDFPDVPAHAHSGWLEVAVMSPEDGAFWPLPEKQAVALKAQICPESWALAGNADTNPLSSFLGTTDSQPLIVRVSGKRALRIEPRGGNETPSIIGGHESNSLGNLADGSFIGGGGTPSFPNRAVGPRNVIAGGSGNATHEFASMVPGGFRNCAGGMFSFAAGHRAKVRGEFNPGGDSACANLGSLGGANGDMGTFVWADSSNEDFVSTGNDQFLVRARGGMGIGTNAPQAPLHAVLTPSDPQPAAFENPVLIARNTSGIDFFTAGVLAEDSGALGYAVIARSTHASGSTRGVDASVSSPSGRAIQASSPAGGYAAFFEGGRVFSQGNLGIGVANPTFQLHLSQDSAAKPNSNTWTISSDERLKTDIETLDGSLERLLALRGVSFRWRDPDAMGGHDGTYAGLIAQNVEQVFPEWVGTDPQGYKTVTVTGFEGLVAEALRELRAEKDAEIAGVVSENLELRERLAALERSQADKLAALREELALLHALLAPAVAGEP
jgi:hypothetical protein